MSFHNPGSWLWAIAAVIVAALYLWRYAGQNRPVAAYWLWQKALARRPAWIGLRRWSSVAMQVLAVMLLVAALAEPYWTSIFVARRNIAVVLDTSASMSVGGSAASRFEEARELTRRAIDNMRRGERMAIIAAASQVRTIQSLSADKPALLAALDRIQPGHGETRIAAAADVARAAVADLPNARVVVISDGCFDEAEDLGQDVRVVLVGSDSGNAAITQLQATPDRGNPSLQHVFIEVANRSDEPFKGELRLSVGGTPLEPRAVAVPPNDLLQELCSITVDTDCLLTASLGPDDALPEDNSAYVEVQAHHKPTAIVVGNSLPQLKSVLSSLTEADVQFLDSTAAAAQDGDVLVLHGSTPETLPPGRLVVIEPQNDCDLWKISGELTEQNSEIGTAKDSYGLLTGVDAEGTIVERATKLEFLQPAETVIASASGAVLYAVIQRPEGRVLVINFPLDRERSDLVLRQDFARMVTNAVRSLLPTSQAATAVSSVTRSTALTPDPTPRRLTSLTGDAIDVAAEQCFASLGQPGVWKWDDAQAPPITVAPASGRESDLRRNAKLTSGELELVEPVFDQPLWMLLIGLAMLIMVIEWCLYHRRYLV